jgi:hypothetical protein
MYVPLPPVLTYRASTFLPDKVKNDSWPFYQRVLEAEWTILVFARWCADIPQRGIMWPLSPRLRANLQELGISKLLQGSKYALSGIQAWLLDHDNHPWASGTQLYAGGGRGQGPSQGARLVEFVRAYPAYRIPLDETPAVAHRGIWAAVVTTMGGSASDGRKSGVHTTDENPRLTAVPRLRSVPLADPHRNRPCFARVHRVRGQERVATCPRGLGGVRQCHRERQVAQNRTSHCWVCSGSCSLNLSGRVAPT